MTSIKKIKLKNLNMQSFYNYFTNFTEPILITNIYDKFPELKNWDMQYLANKISNKLIKVNSSNDGTFTLDPQTGKPYFSPVEITAAEYIRMLKQQNSGRKKLYAQQLSILEDLPELKEDLSIINYIPSEYIEFVNLWFGSGGNTTALHFDGANNFFIQLFGEKKFWLYSPKYFSELYPNSWMSRAPHVSLVNPANIDSISYPKALKVQKTEIVISPGNILFLPAYWWHQVYGINTNISVNIWVKGKFRQKLVSAYFHVCLNSFFTNIEDRFLKIRTYFIR